MPPRLDDGAPTPCSIGSPNSAATQNDAARPQVITRLAEQGGALNLAEGFPDFPAPEPVKAAACAAIAADVNQAALALASRFTPFLSLLRPGSLR